MKRKLLFYVVLAITISLFIPANLTKVHAAEGPSVSYTTHVQNNGWMNIVRDGALSGTTGENKRVEAIKIALENNPYSGSISYKTHVQNYGWLNAVSDGAISGKTGESKRVEAIQISLTGEVSSYYDVYYRVHVQNFGWLDWAKNGQSAGTEGLSKRVESIQIVLVKKGQPAPGPTSKVLLTKPSVVYSSHVQNNGWMNNVRDGALSGTTGENKRVEAVKLAIENSPYSGGITYKTHVQSYGWLNSVSNGAISGKTGESKRVEAIQITLTGDISAHYDVYYRVHSQSYGWLDWAKNGQSAGTMGLSKRVEAVEVVLVDKGGNAPGPTSLRFINDISVNYSTHVQNYGWLGSVSNGTLSGTTGENKRVEELKISLGNSPYSGGITYNTHVQSYGWLNEVSNGAISGKTGESKRIEAIQISLTGEVSNAYDVYYRVHAQTFGWLGWAKNGMKAGTEGLSKRVEAIQVKLVPKGKGEEVEETSAFKTKLYINKTKYDLSLSNAINMQMKTKPQTDKYKNNPAYVNGQYINVLSEGTIYGSSVNLRTSPTLKNDSNIYKNVGNGTPVVILDDNVTGDEFSGNTRWFKIKYDNKQLFVHSSFVKRKGIVTANSINVLAQTNSSSHIYGTYKKDKLLTILKENNGWYEIEYGTWRNATSADVKTYLDPSKYVNDEVQKFQFMDLTKSSELSVDVLNQYLKGKGILDGQGQAFIDAGKTHGINEVYLLAHALLETGNGTSTLAKGVTSHGKKVYNMYGIGAFDSCPLECGTEAAYEYGWDTPYKAIVGGAAFIKDGYLNGNNGYGIVQNTLFEMRWNPQLMAEESIAGHQYASDIGWAYKQVKFMAELYKISQYTLHLDIPVFK